MKSITFHISQSWITSLCDYCMLDSPLYISYEGFTFWGWYWGCCRKYELDIIVRLLALRRITVSYVISCERQEKGTLNITQQHWKLPKSVIFAVYILKVFASSFIEKVQKISDVIKKVWNYRVRRRQANQQQAKLDAKWRPILSLRAVLAWKIGYFCTSPVADFFNRIKWSMKFETDHSINRSQETKDWINQEFSTLRCEISKKDQIVTIGPRRPEKCLIKNDVYYQQLWEKNGTVGWKTQDIVIPSHWSFTQDAKAIFMSYLEPFRYHCVTFGLSSNPSFFPWTKKTSYETYKRFFSPSLGYIL